MAASRLFEQLQKAAAARAAMGPPPVPKPQPQTDTQADDMARDIAALQAEGEVREAELAREHTEEEVPAPGEAIQRFALARGFAVVAVLAALVLGWYFVPWRTPGADPDRAKPPATLKMDPKLDLARPK